MQWEGRVGIARRQALPHGRHWPQALARMERTMWLSHREDLAGRKGASHARGGRGQQVPTRPEGSLKHRLLFYNRNLRRAIFRLQQVFSIHRGGQFCSSCGRARYAELPMPINLALSVGLKEAWR